MKKKNLAWGNYIFPLLKVIEISGETEKRMEKKLVGMFQGKKLRWEGFV